MKKLVILLVCVTLSACASVKHTAQYGFLPGSEYQFYPPIRAVDLDGQHFNLLITDARGSENIKCSDITLPRETELEGAKGYEFFSNYARKFIEANNGVVDSSAKDTIELKLRGLDGKIYGFGFVRIWGLIEFDAIVGSTSKAYCSAMVDGDRDSPLRVSSMDTKKGAFRKMVSGSTRRALEQFVNDLAKRKGSN